MHFSATVSTLAAIMSVVSSGPVVTPEFQQIIYPNTGVVQCKFPHPLIDCRIWVTDYYELPLRFDKVMDFRLGAKSERKLLKDVTMDTLQASATYAGAGLQAGHCGVEIRPEIRWELFVLVQCFGQTEEQGWSRGFGMLTSSGRPFATLTKPSPRYVAVYPGSQVSFELVVNSVRFLESCRFATPSEAVTLFSDRSWTPTGRFNSMGSDMGHGKCRATMANVGPRDAGMWWWWGQRGLEVSYQAAVVVVLNVLAKVPVLQIANASSLKVGDLMTATCRAQPAIPAANLIWFLDGEVVQQHDGNSALVDDLGTVRLWQPQAAVQTFTHRLTARDRGKRLECWAQNVPEVGPRTAGEILNPHFIFATAENKVVHSTIGRRSHLACVVDSDPSPTVTWFRAGVPVKGSPLIVVGNDETRHWLVLEDTTTDDWTEFTCTATNVAGSSSQTIKLTGLPGTPNWVGNATHSQLIWRVESVVPVIGSQLKIRRGTGRWQEFTKHTATQVEEGWQKVVFEHLSVASGKYSAYLRVRNEYGWSPVSSIRNVTLTTQARSKSPTSPKPAAAGCPALAANVMSVRCSLSRANVNCARTPVPLGTTARAECREGYKPEENHPGKLTMRCTAKGWRPPPFTCSLDCGRRKSDSRQLSVGGKEAIESEFPWHVSVFEKKSGSFQPICGGSLVSLSFFISAAHCFWNESTNKPRSETSYMASVGKHTLSWTTTDRYEQRRNLKVIHIPKHFGGTSKRLESDIAVIQLSAPVTVTPAVNIVCVDWKITFEQLQLVNNSLGTVPGWGLTESDLPSPSLRFVDLPFVPYTDCHESVPLGYQDYLLRDKFCGGYTNRTTGVCQGDSGGGYVFPTKKDVGQRYYLRGIVSSAPILWSTKSMVCQGEHRSTFTQVSIFVEWLEGIVYSVIEDD